MPVIGGPAVAATSSASGTVAAGYTVPTGSLANWASVATTAATGLFEVAIFGDSTTYGAALGGSADPFYTWVRRLRELALAAGLPDGGYGIQHGVDAQNGEFNADSVTGLPKVVSRTGWNDIGFAAQYSFRSSANGDVMTMQGTGTAIRITTYRTSSAGVLRYAVDGGATTDVSLVRSTSTGSPYDAVPIYIGGLTSGNHTLTLTNASGSALGVEVNVEWLKGNGVVFHRDALSGVSASTWADSVQNEAKSLTDTPVRLGLTDVEVAGASAVNTYAWGAPRGPRPQYRNVKLAMMQIGTNDITQSDATGSAALNWAEYMENVALWVRTARAAGADVVLISPPFTAATGPNVQRYSGRYKAAMYQVAMSHGCAWVDFQEALGWDPAYWSGKGYGPGTVTNPHLPKVAYQAEAQYLWDKVLKPAAGL